MNNKQAKEAGAKADALHKELYGDSTPAENTDSPKEEPVAKVEAEAPTEQAAPAAEPVTDWEQKFRTLQGKYNAEVPRLHQQVQTLSTQVEVLDREKEAAQEARESLVASADDLDQSTYAEYGEEFERMAETINALQGKLNSVITENSRLKDTVGEIEVSAAENKTDRFYSAITAVVPNWREINTEPKFLEWLQTTDPMTDLSYQDYLNHAADTLDSQKAINIFKTYNESTIQPQVQQDMVERQVQPATTSMATTPTVQKQQYTRRDIKTFYKNAATGVYTKAQKDAIEADIFAAQNEGRIIG